MLALKRFGVRRNKADGPQRHSPTKLPSVVSPENPFTSPFGSPTLVPRYGIAQSL